MQANRSEIEDFGRDFLPVSTWQHPFWDPEGNNTPDYGRLRDLGLWDLSTPDSPTWGYLNSLAYGQDVLEDPNALYSAINRTNFYTGSGGPEYGVADAYRPVYEQQLREVLADLPTEYLDAFVPAAGQAMHDYWQSQDDSVTFRDVAADLGEILSIPPLQIALAAITGGASLGAGGTALGTGALVGAQTGAINAAASRENILKGMLTGGIAGGLGAGAMPGLESSLGGGMLGSAGAGAITGGGRALLTGGDVMSGIRGGALSGIANYDAPTVDPRRLQLADAGATTGITADTLPEGGYSMPARTGGTDIFGNEIMSSSPALTVVPGVGEVPTEFLTPSSPMYFGSDYNLNSGVDAGTNLNAPAVSTQDVQRYARVAKAVNDLLNSGQGATEGAPAGAPTQDEGETPEVYAEELAQYLSLDAQDMADQGLTPGSPEYYEYIMAQADAIINQALEGMDVDAEDLSQQLRTKTDEELQQLQRALYVRGQIDMLMGAGTYTDPLSGTPEEVIGDGMFNPNVAAFQRGRARDVQTLAGLSGEEAQDYLQGLLDRDFDPFGMQSQADARFELAKRNEMEDEDLRRRRGMLQY